MFFSEEICQEAQNKSLSPLKFVEKTQLCRTLVLRSIVRDFNVMFEEKSHAAAQRGSSPGSQEFLLSPVSVSFLCGSAKIIRFSNGNR